MTGILIVKPFAAAGGPAVGEVSIDDHSFTGPTVAQFGVSNVGLIYGTQGRDGVDVAESWIEPQVGMDQFDVLVHQVSGNAINLMGNSPLDAWLQLNVHRWWGYGSTSGAMTGVFEVSIRLRATGEILDTATFTLYTPGDSGISGGSGGSGGGGGVGGPGGSIFDGIYTNSK